MLVTAESLPTDPQPADPGTEHPEDANDTGSTDDPGNIEDTDPGDADNTCAPRVMGEPGEMGSTDAAAPAQDEGFCQPTDAGDAEATAGAGSETEAGADAAANAAAVSADHATTAPHDEKASGPGAGERGTCEREAGEQRAGGRGVSWRDTASTSSAKGVDSAPIEDERPVKQDNAPVTGEGGAPSEVKAAGPEWTDQTADARFSGGDSGRPHTAPDPPPEDVAAHHAHAGHRPAGDCRRGQATREDHGDVRCGQCRYEPGCDEQGRSQQGLAQQGWAQQGWAQQDLADGRGACGCSGEPGSSSGEMPGKPPGTAPGTLPGALLGTAPGVLLGTAPGVLLATGQMLPVSSVHRLARTSTLVRLVMDADGQVLDMGRKVRLATPAQRRAVYARYATCWIDGCPLPATMCQIDHADNWSNAGLTDLKLLGPACQFHNRDRYRHPDRYTRRKISTDRWAFTYHPARTMRLRL